MSRHVTQITQIAYGGPWAIMNNDTGTSAKTTSSDAGDRMPVAAIHGEPDLHKSVRENHEPMSSKINSFA